MPAPILYSVKSGMTGIGTRSGSSQMVFGLYGAAYLFHFERSEGYFWLGSEKPEML